MEKLNRNTWKESKKYPVKVLQFGEGNFLRAFVNWQIDKMNKETDFNGGVVVAQPIEFGLIDKLNEQEGLYTLFLQGIKNEEAVREHSVIDCINYGINPYANYDQLLEVTENPELRFIISNTTEAGITFEENDRLSDSPQKSFPGKLTALLYHRFNTFAGAEDKGFVILPCELIDRNGEKLKEIVLKYIELWNLELGFKEWVLQSNTFCCTLVDRIVTGYPRDTIDEITTELGYKDELVVVGEQFHLWVIEGPQWISDEFPTNQAGLNVKVVNDMTPYRTRKVRILNGAHTAMTPVCYLYGLDTVGDSMKDEVTRDFIERLIFDEIIPTLDLPEEELKSFASAVLERFMNPYVNHYLLSIALNSMSKFKTRDLPTLIEYHGRTGELPRRLVFSLSALIALYKGKRDSEEINLQDDDHVMELYSSLWKDYDGSEDRIREIVTTVLAYEKNWELDLTIIPGLTDMVTEFLVKIERSGMKVAIKDVTKISLGN